MALMCAADGARQVRAGTGPTRATAPPRAPATSRPAPARRFRESPRLAGCPPRSPGRARITASLFSRFRELTYPRETANRPRTYSPRVRENTRLPRTVSGTPFCGNAAPAARPVTFAGRREHGDRAAPLPFSRSGHPRAPAHRGPARASGGRRGAAAEGTPPSPDTALAPFGRERTGSGSGLSMGRAALWRSAPRRRREVALPWCGCRVGAVCGAWLCGARP